MVAGWTSPRPARSGGRSECLSVRACPSAPWSRPPPAGPGRLPRTRIPRRAPCRARAPGPADGRSTTSLSGSQGGAGGGLVDVEPVDAMMRERLEVRAAGDGEVVAATDDVAHRRQEVAVRIERVEPDDLARVADGRTGQRVHERAPELDLLAVPDRHPVAVDVGRQDVAHGPDAVGLEAAAVEVLDVDGIAPRIHVRGRRGDGTRGSEE